MYGSEIRWRSVTLVYAYAVDMASVSRIMGVSERAIQRWYRQFIVSGHIMPAERRHRITNRLLAYIEETPVLNSIQFCLYSMNTGKTFKSVANRFKLTLFCLSNRLRGTPGCVADQGTLLYLFIK